MNREWTQNFLQKTKTTERFNPENFKACESVLKITAKKKMDRLETETIQKKGIILGSIRVQLANLEKSLGEVNKRIVKPIQTHLKQV